MEGVHSPLNKLVQHKVENDKRSTDPVNVDETGRGNWIQQISGN